MIISLMKEDNKNIFFSTSNSARTVWEQVTSQRKQALIDYFVGWHVCIPLYHFFKKKIFFACNLLWILSWKYDTSDRLHRVCMSGIWKGACLGGTLQHRLYSDMNHRKGDVEREFLGLFLCFISNLHHQQPLLRSTWKLPNCTGTTVERRSIPFSFQIFMI